MKIFTIGFTKKTAESFFTRLKKSEATRLVDVRLNNVSQLAGFAKRDDLKYFSREICGIDYMHLLDLAPTQDLLDSYKKEGGPWMDYERRFVDLISKRRIEDQVPKELIDGACLLCSEDKPHHCHRRLVAEYLAAKWPDVDVCHL